MPTGQPITDAMSSYDMSCIKRSSSTSRCSGANWFSAAWIRAALTSEMLALSSVSSKGSFPSSGTSMRPALAKLAHRPVVGDPIDPSREGAWIRQLWNRTKNVEPYLL